MEENYCAMSSGPNFLVIGAQKCGTTWLEKNLGAHPEICTPKHKELHFFDKQEVFLRGQTWYEDQFHRLSPDQIAGEFTPNYFWLPSSEEEARESGQLPDIARRVQDLYPDVKIIVALRDPVDRAKSAYYHHIRARRVKPSEGMAEVQHRYGIASMGNYAHCLEEWLSVFPRESFLFVVYDDIVREPIETIQAVYNFLGVDIGFTPKEISRRRNRSNSHFLLRMNHLVPNLARLIQKYYPTFGSRWNRFSIDIHSEELSSLRAYYREDTERLEAILERRLPWA